jgi:hypothetical protein
MKYTPTQNKSDCILDVCQSANTNPFCRESDCSNSIPELLHISRIQDECDHFECFEIDFVNMLLICIIIILIILSIICIFYFSLLLQQGIEPNPGPIDEFDDFIDEISDTESSISVSEDPNVFEDLLINLQIADHTPYPLAQPDDDIADNAFNLNNFQFPYEENSDLIYNSLLSMPSFLSNLDNPLRVHNACAKVSMYY